MAVFGSRALMRAAVVLVLVAAAAAQSKSVQGSKTLTGKICSKADPACVKCTKSSSGSLKCLECSSGAELNDKGRCVCPPGFGVVSSSSSSGKKNSNTAAHGSHNGGGGSGSRKCTECPEDTYAPDAKPIASAKCLKCPTGTTTRGETGSTTCYVEPGYYFDPSKPDGQQVIICPVDKYCPGGDITKEGLEKNDCPAGSGTQGTTGNDAISDCIVPPGSYFDGNNVVKCPVGKYCLGGPVDGAGKIATPCPAGTTTASTGSTSISQCLVPPGSYWDGSKVVLCQAGNYCLGGPVDGAGKEQKPCPPGQTSNPGASSVTQCFAICTLPEIFCAPSCTNPNTDNNNCGACGNKCEGVAQCTNGKCLCGVEGPGSLVCPVGAVCNPFGQNQVPTCQCTATKVPAFNPTPGTCNTLVQAGTSGTKEYTVTPGQPYSITYDAFAIPDRFVVVDGTPCGAILLDTGFVGQTDYGCTSSKPCCPIGSGAGCTGAAGSVCPADPIAKPPPGGGGGAATTATFTPASSKIYVVGFGVCQSTSYEYTLNCP